MHNIYWFRAVVWIGLLAGVLSACERSWAGPAPSVIAFGSCARQHKPQPVWHAILAQQPDLMLMLGDNVYLDTTDVGVMHRKYRQLGVKPGFKLLRKHVPVLATWDDHDFGRNNAGRHYPKKDAAQQAMLSFFNEPADSPRWRRRGVYRAWTFGPAQQRLQIILLDTRYFRDRPPKNTKPGAVDELSEQATSKTILGQKQWQWLKKQLEKPADVRLIGSSIQVVPTQHGHEKWGKFPHERQRLFDLIDATGAKGVVFLSGDRHFLELSRDIEHGPYPMYDFTSSGLNTAGGPKEPNHYRVGEAKRVDNFGLVRINWNADPVTLTFDARRADGRRLMAHTIAIDQLQPNLD
jgi:alkaline phosphatase D